MSAQIHVLAAQGTGLVLEIPEDGKLPRVVHWGADPGPVVPSAPYGQSALPLLPVQEDGWFGRPAILAGGFVHPRLRLTAPATITPATVSVDAADTQAGLSVNLQIQMTPEGIIKTRCAATNTGAATWPVNTLKTLLPVPGQATEILDFTGRWALERVPQRLPLGFGAHVRENRRGRTGHDATTLLAAGTQGFSNQRGEIWAVHIGWSGNHEHTVERNPDYVTALGGGELLQPGELMLAPGNSYTTPWAYFAYSPSGLDGIRQRFHAYVRSRPQHPATPRPVVLNTWEAVYFDQNPAQLKALADTAASVGVERFVLDDGWFRDRRSDSAGLGDWYPDETVWPRGLRPLSDHVHALGMQFGLWFEPEMVNPDSDLYCAHPEWVLGHSAGRLPAEFRHQHCLDVAHPDVFAYLLERLSTVVSEAAVDFIKWDHNRDLAEAPQVHHQTHAVYRLLESLKQRHPGLEIESCSSGGARVDLGILEYTDRVWASDTNDPIDRQHIQLWTGLLLPPELIGAHVGPQRTHVTGRVTSLEMRMATALFGHAGLELDLTQCSGAELAQIQNWIALYKRCRETLHTGTVVVPDQPCSSSVVLGVVSPSQDHALFSYAQLASTAANTPLAPAPMRLLFPGLKHEYQYHIETVLAPRGDGLVPTSIDPGGAVFSGAALQIVGLPVPRLNPGDAIVFELRSQTGASC